MSRLSRSQRAGRESVPAVSRPIGDHYPVGTKETLHKRVSLSGQPAQEGSPFGEAAPSRPGPQRESGASPLLTEVRVVFPFRRKLYSTDVFGRSSEIETGHISADAYQALLEAYQNPIRFDGPPQGYELTGRQYEPIDPPVGCRLGPETGLPLPEWWELPEAEATEGDILVMIRRNFERAQREGKGALARVLAASLARI